MSTAPLPKEAFYVYNQLNKPNWQRSSPDQVPELARLIRRAYAAQFPDGELNKLTSPGLPSYRMNLIRMAGALLEEDYPM